ncbi:MAG: HAD family phosphatase [Spirochaetaceae bacterium]|jgi:beta-phosphoglucomutase-like phosphatase (HAD superfamily)|nr:HAD family phosphatase [Spirochaetaceae bacterium]
MSDLQWEVPALGTARAADGFTEKNECTDGVHKKDKNGVRHILATGDGKIELIVFADHTLVWVNSDMGSPAWYPLRPVTLQRPVKAVLMDLDGTTVHSEEFWIWIIQKTICSVLKDEHFELAAEDTPFVSGHSVSEHLQYCLKKYAPHASLQEARAFYTEHTKQEMDNIMNGCGKPGAFTPAPGIKPFLLALKERGIKIGLVTSGLYRKAWPEILSAFDTLGLGDPADFYDCIITAGQPLGEGEPGTMGELEAKPHPWLYAEVARVGLGIPSEERGQVIGIEDSGAGVCAVRLAGYYTVGIASGNIVQSGTLGMCNSYCRDFEEILRLITGE